MLANAIGQLGQYSIWPNTINAEPSCATYRWTPFESEAGSGDHHFRRNDTRTSLGCAKIVTGKQEGSKPHHALKVRPKLASSWSAPLPAARSDVPLALSASKRVQDVRYPCHMLENKRLGLKALVPAGAPLFDIYQFDGHVFRACNANDWGMSAYSVKDDGTLQYEQDFFLMGQKIWRHNNGVLSPGPAIRLPMELDAEYMTVPSKFDPNVAEGYLKVCVSFTAPDGSKRYNHLAMPYGTYSPPNGECRGMVHIGGYEYTFLKPGAWDDGDIAGSPIKLTRASEADFLQHVQYRTLFHNTRFNYLDSVRAPELAVTVPLSGQMRLFQAPVKQMINAALRDVDRILAISIGLIDAKDLAFFSVCKRFMLPGQDVATFTAGLRAMAVSLSEHLGWIKLQKEYIIGLGSLNTERFGRFMGMSLHGSLVHEVSHAWVPHPSIWFDVKFVNEASRKEIADTLLHELTHAVEKTSDNLASVASLRDYPARSHDRVDCKEMLAEIQRVSANVLRHAPALEVIFSLADQLQEPLSRPQALRFSKGIDDGYAFYRMPTVAQPRNAAALINA